MGINNTEYGFQTNPIIKATIEHFKQQEITETCPVCNARLECVEYGNSYVVRCKTENCTNVEFRGI